MRIVYLAPPGRQARILHWPGVPDRYFFWI
jgi:hypothetical protein